VQRSVKTLDRSVLHAAQTPQVAQLGLLTVALQAAQAQGVAVTDEASALEIFGVPVTLVQGSARNFKVTTQQDAALMELIMDEEHPKSPVAPATPFRIGEGMDVHALVLGRPLILGGITIPHTHGLQGHSDADALCHALTDALLGAAAMGDIGRMFPDTDAQYAGADSTQLLAKAYAAVRAAGWALVNADATIIAQAPKLAAHIPAMQARLAQVLGCELGQITVKAKTNENLGFLGRKEGIECRVTVLLSALTR
jgi:2-C-methyl-D-erythritol 4-phosphate cytidylyltransferase/2-C-methyl-D-erythritol 2,4-cyclodiphosphate synthase